jgi:nitronate monooxygenase
MGVGVSSCRLARTVSRCGQLGVVSGTGIGALIARKMQMGDEAVRRAAEAFPLPEVAERLMKRYFVPGGLAPGQPFKLTPMPLVQFGQALMEITVFGNFAEVWMAKEGHDGLVGINFLEKIQTPTLPSIYGAMLANVDYILMGAGIPRSIPGALDAFSENRSAELRIDVENSPEPFMQTFDPLDFCGGKTLSPKRPAFLAIVASNILAVTLQRKSNGKVDGFVIEGPTAGGHNAPPRGPVQLTARGEPVYGERDVVDLKKICELGLPFYLAGGYGTPESYQAAMASGANGVQVGTAFAFSNESGMRLDLKQRAISLAMAGEAGVLTDPRASPTGFPFKVVQMPGTLAEEDVYQARKRICDLGYLRRPYRKPDGSMGYRCSSEPVEDYVAKGGDIAETVGRKCLCNGLLSTLGMSQIGLSGELEPPVVTAGDDVSHLLRYLKNGATSYSATEVLEYLLQRPMPKIEDPVDDVAESMIPTA